MNFRELKKRGIEHASPEKVGGERFVGVPATHQPCLPASMGRRSTTAKHSTHTKDSMDMAVRPDTLRPVP